tara:strand:+ start:1881 stop:2456 length:576 start_codon:yes stop_codon:yes gene_type:complete
MARTKYDHRRFYNDRDRRSVINKWLVKSGQIVTFPYPAYDKRPLVFVMDTDEYASKIEQKSFSGINLNYLPLQEINIFFIKMLSKAGWELDKHTNFPKVNLWEEEDPGLRPEVIYKNIVKKQLLVRRDAWRTYKYKKIRLVEHINFRFIVSPLDEVADMGFVGRKKISESTMYRKVRGVRNKPLDNDEYKL